MEMLEKNEFYLFKFPRNEGKSLEDGISTPRYCDYAFGTGPI